MPRRNRTPSEYPEYIYSRSEPVTESGCWIWTLAVDKDGYGRAWLGNKKWPAHRLSYMTFMGPIPAGLFVLHKCDNPSCVNPAHLFVGTPLDNMRDKCNKGRVKGARRGENHHRAKLASETVISIRAKYDSGQVGARALAKEYGIAYRHAWNIVKRRIWKYI